MGMPVSPGPPTNRLSDKSTRRFVSLSGGAPMPLFEAPQQPRIVEAIFP